VSAQSPFSFLFDLHAPNVPLESNPAIVSVFNGQLPITEGPGGFESVPDGFGKAPNRPAMPPNGSEPFASVRLIFQTMVRITTDPATQILQQAAFKARRTLIY
jgi:hypothetical protein